jgi:hypothetical protein
MENKTTHTKGPRWMRGLTSGDFRVALDGEGLGSYGDLTQAELVLRYARRYGSKAFRAAIAKASGA